MFTHSTLIPFPPTPSTDYLGGEVLALEAQAACQLRNGGFPFHFRVGDHVSCAIPGRAPHFTPKRKLLQMGNLALQPGDTCGCGCVGVMFFLSCIVSTNNTITTHQEKLVRAIRTTVRIFFRRYAYSHTHLQLHIRTLLPPLGKYVCTTKYGNMISYTSNEPNRSHTLVTVPFHEDHHFFPDARWSGRLTVGARKHRLEVPGQGHCTQLTRHACSKQEQQSSKTNSITHKHTKRMQ